jgi:hypothetical protein
MALLKTYKCANRVTNRIEIGAVCDSGKRGGDA